MCDVCVASKILAKENKDGVWLGWPEGYGLFVKAKADAPEFKPAEAFVRKTIKEEKHEGEWSPVYKYLRGWGEPTDLLDAWKLSGLG